MFRCIKKGEKQSSQEKINERMRKLAFKKEEITKEIEDDQLNGKETYVYDRASERYYPKNFLNNQKIITIDKKIEKLTKKTRN